MSLKSFIFALLILLLLTGTASASLSAPTTYSIGYKIWGKYWDMMGENGLRNGTLGGVGNNVTFLDGSGITFLPTSGTTADLDMNGKNISNVRVINSTQVNVTTVNATNIDGNGSGIYQLNASNLTNPIAAINGSALFGLNMSNQTTCRGNMTCTYNANGSVSLDATSNTTAIFNQILNTSTVTAGVSNGKVELTAATGTSQSMTGSYSNFTNTTNSQYNISASTRYWIAYKTNAPITVDTSTLTGTAWKEVQAYGLDFPITASPVASGKIYHVAISDGVNIAEAGAVGGGANDNGYIMYSSVNTSAQMTNVTYYNMSSQDGINVLVKFALYSNTAGGQPGTLLFSTTNQTNANPWLNASVKNLNLTANHSLNVPYLNTNLTNSLMLQATLRFQPAANTSVLSWCVSDSKTFPSTEISGKVGTENGLLNDDFTQQLTCIIQPGKNYAINTTGNTISLRSWMENQI